MSNISKWPRGCSCCCCCCGGQSGWGPQRWGVSCSCVAFTVVIPRGMVQPLSSTGKDVLPIVGHVAVLRTEMSQHMQHLPAWGVMCSRVGLLQCRRSPLASGRPCFTCGELVVNSMFACRRAATEGGNRQLAAPGPAIPCTLRTMRQALSLLCFVEPHPMPVAILVHCPA